MNEIKTKVQILVKQELQDANKKFTLFNSMHEGYAVILEEIEECESEINDLKFRQGDFWTMIKSNNMAAQEGLIKEMKQKAINAACEAIQVAAMCEKYKASCIDSK